MKLIRHCIFYSLLRLTTSISPYKEYDVLEDVHKRSSPSIESSTRVATPTALPIVVDSDEHFNIIEQSGSRNIATTSTESNIATAGMESNEETYVEIEITSSGTELITNTTLSSAENVQNGITESSTVSQGTTTINAIKEETTPNEIRVKFESSTHSELVDQNTPASGIDSSPDLSQIYRKIFPYGKKMLSATSDTRN